MASDEFKQRPLLYIEQPTIELPKAQMQTYYQTANIDKIRTEEIEHDSYVEEIEIEQVAEETEYLSSKKRNYFRDQLLFGSNYQMPKESEELEEKAEKPNYLIQKHNLLSIEESKSNHAEQLDDTDKEIEEQVNFVKNILDTLNAQKRIVQEQPSKSNEEDQVEVIEVEERISEDLDDVVHEERSEAEEDIHVEPKFKDLSLREKVNYCLKRSKDIVAIKCVIFTEEHEYRGLIVDFKEEHVYLQAGKNVHVEIIPFKTIRDIQLIGF